MDRARPPELLAPADCGTKLTSMGTRAALATIAAAAASLTACGGDDAESAVADVVIACGSVTDSLITGADASDRLIEINTAESEFKDSESHLAVVTAAEAILVADADDLEAAAKRSDRNARAAEGDAEAARAAATIARVNYDLDVMSTTLPEVQQLEALAADKEAAAVTARDKANADQVAADKARAAADDASAERAMAEERYASAQLSRPTEDELEKLLAEAEAAASKYSAASSAVATAAADDARWDSLLGALTRLESSFGHFENEAPWDPTQLQDVRNDEATVVAECRKAAAAQS